MAEIVALDAFQHRFLPGSSPAGWTVAVFHGTGGNEDDLIPLAQALLPGAAVLSPRGNVSEGGALRFFRRHAEGVLDQADLHARTIEMDGWLATAATEYRIDLDRLVCAGFSNGANLLASMLLRAQSQPTHAVLLSPMLPFALETAIDLAGRNVFIGSGRIDPLVPVDQVTALELALTDSGAAVNVAWTPSGHSITADELKAAQEWVRSITGA